MQLDDFSSWLNHLRCLYPVKTLIHLGAGRGSAIQNYVLWKIPHVIFIEAETQLYKRLLQITEPYLEWSVHQAVIDKEEKTSLFYLANNTNESGLIQPESQKKRWANLKTKSVYKIKTIKLSTLIKQYPENIQTDLNWLIIDCLPAFDLLKSCENYLEQIEVIIARVTINELEGDIDGISRIILEQFLINHQFQYLTQKNENNQIITQVIYVKKYALKLDLSVKNLETAQQQVQAVTQEKNTKVKSLETAQQQIQALTQEKNTNVKNLENAQQQIQALTQEKNTNVKNLENAQQQIQALTQERNTKAKNLETVQQQIKDLTQQQQIQLENMNKKESLSNQEFMKIEAQFNLLKELFSEKPI